MKVLLDTHAFLWFCLDDSKLSFKAMEAIRTSSNDVSISPASYSEIAIKISSGKYKLDISYEQLWRDGILANSIGIIPIELRHTNRLISLPFHHKDPFDRLLVAQSLAENIPLISADSLLDAYGIERIW